MACPTRWINLEKLRSFCGSTTKKIVSRKIEDPSDTRLIREAPSLLTSTIAKLPFGHSVRETQSRSSSHAFKSELIPVRLWRPSRSAKQRRLSSSVAALSWTMRFAGQVLRMRRCAFLSSSTSGVLWFCYFDKGRLQLVHCPGGTALAALLARKISRVLSTPRDECSR